MTMDLSMFRGGNADDLYGRLEMLRPVYLKSKEREEGKDPEWEVRKKFIISKVCSLVKSFTAEDSSTKAVLLIGQMQALVTELDQPRINILQYETLQKQYQAATAQ